MMHKFVTQEGVRNSISVDQPPLYIGSGLGLMKNTPKPLVPLAVSYAWRGKVTTFSSRNSLIPTITLCREEYASASDGSFETG